MSRGSIFTLVTQDDSTDKFFTAFDILIQRIQSINLSGRIPDTRDIERTHLLYTRSKYMPYVAMATDYIKVSPVGDSTSQLGMSGGTIEFTIPNYGHFTSDMVLHVSFSALGDKAAYAANLDPTTEKPMYRYCSYPGIRLLENVELRSDSVLVDSYVPEDVIAYKNFFVNANHRNGWNRCFGQDEVQHAAYNSKSFTGIINYSNGFQTPKLYQEEFNMFIPLHFWFCGDVSDALINGATTNGQKTIRITLASLDKIVQSLIYTVDNSNPPNITQIGTAIVPLPITKLKMTTALYVNNLYTYPEIYNIISSELNFAMIRVHKRQFSPILAATDNILFNQLHYPGEFLAVGFRNKVNANDFDRWHLMGSDILTEDVNNLKTLFVPAIIWNMEHGIRQLVTREAAQLTTLNSIVDSLGITVYGGITIYPTLPYNFYNDYLPIRYAKNSVVVSPFDNNMFLITFCLYPGKSNPSGHFNLTTSREIYLNYTMNADYSDLLSNSYEMVTSMSALNFLIREGDSIRLKYSM